MEFVGDHRILSMCVISVLEAKRLLHKGCKAYMAHVVDNSTPKVTLKNVPVVQEFSNVFFEDLPRLPLNRELEFVLICCWDQLLFLYQCIKLLQLS